VLDGTVATTTTPTDCVMWYRAECAVPSFKLCKPIFWKWSQKYCLTHEDMRRAQRRQFEVETAQLEQNGSVVGSIAGTSTGRKSPAVMLEEG